MLGNLEAGKKTEIHSGVSKGQEQMIHMQPPSWEGDNFNRVLL